MKTVYNLTATQKEGITVYGVEAVTCIDDVFTDKKEAVTFIEKCNSHKLSIIHFTDAIEDCLASK